MKVLSILPEITVAADRSASNEPFLGKQMTEAIYKIQARMVKKIQSPTLIDQVGHTPLLPLNRVFPSLSEDVQVYAKAEWFNPSGSVKDRPAAQIMKTAIESGRLRSGMVLLDSTSGNMGIAYATFASSLGIPLHLAIPSNAGEMKLNILRKLKADLTLTDPLEGSDGARKVASVLADREPERFYFADQYMNDENWRAHYISTGPEIEGQTNGYLTHFISGLGTTGTMMGTGRYLRENVPGIRLIAVQPDGPFHGIEGLKHLETTPQPEIYDATLPDEIIKVSTEEAYSMARRMAKMEGLLVGVSAAAAVAATEMITKRITGGFLVVLLPDSGLKYLNQPFWREP
jgi:cysteine synthase B